MLVVTTTEKVAPRRTAIQRGIGNDGRTFEHVLRFTEILQPIIGARPDAVLVVQFATPIEGTATRAIARVLGTRISRAKITSFRQ
jgi:hypothetical protein